VQNRNADEKVQEWRAPLNQLPTPENEIELVKIHNEVAFAYNRLLPETKFCQLDKGGKQGRVDFLNALHEHSTQTDNRTIVTLDNPVLV
jgi:hypothetical protein